MPLEPRHDRRLAAAAALRRLATRVGWLLAAAAIALGTAGIIEAVGGPTGAVDHPELTWSADQAIRPGLSAALGDLRSIASDVDALGAQGRIALAALAARDQAHLEGAVTAGAALVDRIDAAAIALRGRLRALPGIDGAAPPLPPPAELRLGAATRARYEALDQALGTTQGLSDDWVRLTDGSLAALRLADLLEGHDASTASAAKLGRDRRYAAAVAQLAASDAAIAEARTLRDRLQNTVDVTTLTRWLDLNAAYDAALRELYSALRASGGNVDARVRTAFAAEKTAREALPGDTRGLVVIMGEVARGGINQAVIGIEQARGQLAAQVAALEAEGADGGGVGGEAGPSATPAASASG